jgi:hypothetical protein
MMRHGSPVHSSQPRQRQAGGKQNRSGFKHDRHRPSLRIATSEGVAQLNQVIQG